MSIGLSRAVLRRQLLAVNRSAPRSRYASTAQETASNVAKSAGDAAQAAKDKVAPVASKASEGLTKVASQAGNYASQAASAAGKAAGNVGGPIGRLIGAVQGLVPPTIYYSRVALELGKLVFHQRQMAPPSVQTFQNYWTGFVKYLRAPSAISNAASSVASSPTSILSRAQNVSNKEIAAAGIVAAELLGFFTVGEMIGKFKVVGYRSKQVHHHE